MVVHNVLNVDQTDDVERFRELFRVIDDNLFDVRREVLAGVNRNRVARVYSRALNVLHNAGDYEIIAVANRVNLDFRSHHIFIDKNGIFQLVGGDYLHILRNVRVAVRDNHILSAENVRRTEQNGITKLVCRFQRFFLGKDGFSLRTRDIALFKQLVKQLSVLRRVNIGSLRSENANAHFREVFRELNRGLSAKLHNAAVRLFGCHKRFNVLFGERVEVKARSRVKVRGNGFGVVVADNRFAALFLQRPHAVNRAIIELNSLSYSDRSRTENDNLFLVGRVLLDELGSLVLIIKIVVEIRRFR